MTREYKVTYKTFLNSRLKKKVSLHGVMTYPLYVQVIFDRLPIHFKSNLFELLSKPRFGLTVAGKRGGPTIEQIIQAESEHIDFVIDRTLDAFSLEHFQRAYKFYCSDLLELMSNAFTEYVYTFFHDKGTPNFAMLLKTGIGHVSASILLDELKIVCKREVYQELVDNSLHYAPPYIPLYEFVRSIRKWPMQTLTIKDWQEAKGNNAFSNFIARHYPALDSAEVIAVVDKWASFAR